MVACRIFSKHEKARRQGLTSTNNKRFKVVNEKGHKRDAPRLRKIVLMPRRRWRHSVGAGGGRRMMGGYRVYHDEMHDSSV